MVLRLRSWSWMMRSWSRSRSWTTRSWSRSWSWTTRSWSRSWSWTTRSWSRSWSWTPRSWSWNFGLVHNTATIICLRLLYPSPQSFPFETRVSPLQELLPCLNWSMIIYLPILDLNDTHLNSYSAPSDPLETGLGPPSDYSLGQPFWLDAALVNKLVPCAWLSSGALEVWRLLLRLTLFPTSLHAHIPVWTRKISRPWA